MRIVARSTLKKFWEIPQHADSEGPLKAWYAEVRKAQWSNPAEVKDKYRSVSVLKNERLVFNIAGNKYRLIVRVNYKVHVVYVRFVGTHAEYDGVDAESV